VKPLTAHPARETEILHGTRILDGANSMVPMHIAIRILRQRLGPDRAISVFHIDQASNDFNSLFEILDADPDRYCLDEPSVFPGAIGRSFYENLLPPNSVHLAWCSYAAV
jgi:hypothetical protein